jgi:hypothetical protein
MRIQDFDKIKAHVTFSRSIVRVFMEEGEFLVKFFRGEAFTGESILRTLEWRAFPNDNVLGDWKIEFWDIEGKSLEGVHYHLVHGSRVLFVPSPKNSNLSMVEKLIQECRDAQNKGAKCWVFFEGAHEYGDLFKKEGINLFKIGGNTRMNFPFIIEKEF